jgi:N-acetylneuraminate synthase
MHRTLVIAEGGVNHNGNLNMALQLVDEAANAGADIIKFQSFFASELVCPNAPKAEYQLKTTGTSVSQYEMLRPLELSESMHKELATHCKKRGIEFLSTPFDLPSVDLLHGLGVKRLKIASGDITFAPLLLKVARLRTQIILSTGMSTLTDVEQALALLAFGLMHPEEAPTRRRIEDAYFSQAGQRLLQENVSLLHCTSEYPAPFEDVNLRCMATLQDAFNLPVGISDHTVGIAIPIAAVALGAGIVEKHFTLNRNLEGPDHHASITPHELQAMVRSIRQVEAALGCGRKLPTSVELKNRSLVRRSIVAAGSIEKDCLLTTENLNFKRPGSGISPMLVWEYLGTKAERTFASDEPL